MSLPPSQPPGAPPGRWPSPAGPSPTLPGLAPRSLLTERLCLRHWQATDLDAYAAMNADPRVMRYFPALQTAEASGRAIDTWQQALQQRGWSNFAVAWRGGGAFIGFVGLSVPQRVLPFMQGDTPCVEIGWRLTPSAWGQGLATEAAQAALALGLGELGLEEIVSFTARLNTPSQAVMRRLGMATDPAEDFDHPALPEGHPLRPHVLYRLRRRSWLARQPGG